MNQRITHVLAVASLLALSTTLHAVDGPAQQQADAVKNVSNTPPVPATPAAVLQLLEARPFTLVKGYENRWGKEHAMVQAGYLIVVRVQSDYVYPRQVAQPVLMVGAQVAEPMNIGYAAQTVVAIVPSALKADGTLELDLATVPIFFGQPILAETIDAGVAAQQLAFATRNGIVPMAPAAIDAAHAKAHAKAGVATSFADREALEKVIGGLVRTYAADETDRANELEGKAVADRPVIVQPVR